MSNAANLDTEQNGDTAHENPKIKPGLRVVNEHGASYTVFESVSGKPGYWSIRINTIASGFHSGNGRTPTLEMSEDDIIEMYWDEQARNAAREIKTTGSRSSVHVQRRLDTKPFTRKFYGNGRPSPKLREHRRIHEALQRVTMKMANGAAIPKTT